MTGLRSIQREAIEDFFRSDFDVKELERWTVHHFSDLRN